jgi:hypothetical protein
MKTKKGSTPTLLEYIPFYGMIKYFKRYFNAEKRDSKDAITALWFEFYHIITSVFIVLAIIIRLIH